MEIIKEYTPPKHCKKSADFKFMLYDGGWGDTGAFCFFQCSNQNCKVIIKSRISDAKSS